MLALIITNNSAIATFPGANGKIAFHSDREGGTRIYMMDEDGTNQQRFPGTELFDFTARWSPDGTKIAFESFRDGNGEIYTMNADGTNVQRLTNNPDQDIESAWSPDGTRIAFMRHPIFESVSEIFVVNSDGSNERNLTNNPLDDREPNWSPDGTKIAFASNRDHTYEIYVMNTDGTNVQKLSIPSLGFLNKQRPNWSPDSTKIAFDVNTGDNQEIYVMNADGTNLLRLTNNPSQDFEPRWSPDGAKIAFESNRSGNYEIYLMNPDGSNPTNITNNPAFDISPDWQPIIQSSFSISEWTPSQWIKTDNEVTPTCTKKPYCNDRTSVSNVIVQGNDVHLRVSDNGMKAAGIISTEKVENNYGVYEAKMKFSNTPGVRYSFFLYSGINEGQNEIDIIEIDVKRCYIGITCAQASSTIHKDSSTRLDTSVPVDLGRLLGLGFGGDATRDYHTYKLFWSPSRIEVSIDGIIFYCITDIRSNDRTCRYDPRDVQEVRNFNEMFIIINSYDIDNVGGPSSNSLLTVDSVRYQPFS